MMTPQHNTPTETMSSNTRSSLISSLLDHEQRGLAAGLDDVVDLTLYADADTNILDAEGFSSVHAEDVYPVVEEDVTVGSSAPSTTLQVGGPSPDFRQTFDEGNDGDNRIVNNNNNNIIDPTAAVPDGQKHLVTPSGATGAFLGLCLGGPVGAALWGFGAAYAVRKDGAVGDLARSLGEVGLTAREAFLELDEKHQFSQQWEKTNKNLFEDSRVAAAAADGFQSVAEYTKRHQLLERGVENTGRGFEYLAEKISGRTSTTSSSESRDDDGDYSFDYQMLNEEFRRHNDGTFYCD